MHRSIGRANAQSARAIDAPNPINQSRSPKQNNSRTRDFHLHALVTAPGDFLAAVFDTGSTG